MDLHSVPIEPIIALVAGIVILVQPSLLNYIVAIYLIIIGIIGLAPRFFS
jgi:threonine/homoserine efflux transporter RhtA